MKRLFFLLLILPIGSVQAQASFKVLAITSKAKDHRAMMACAKPFLEAMGANHHFSVDVSDDTSLVNTHNLAQYAVVIMLQEAPFDMSGDQQKAVQAFVEQGGGWVGIHAAGLTGKQFGSGHPSYHYWQWFEEFMGGVVYSPHPKFQPGVVIVEDRTHPVTRNLPEKFQISDEWYEFDKSPRPNVHVLARADESSYHQNKPMGDHPIIWTNPRYDRMVYIGIGHDASLCSDPNFGILIRDAIRWAAKK
jgi:type 1 glutamine amidotransferase